MDVSVHVCMGAGGGLQVHLYVFLRRASKVEGADVRRHSPTIKERAQMC